MNDNSKILDKYLDNKTTDEETVFVRKWLTTNDGQECVSRRLDSDIERITETDAKNWAGHAVPYKRMKRRFMDKISRTFSWRVLTRVAAVLIPLLIGGMLFFADRAGVFAKMEYIETVVPNGMQMQVVLQDGTFVNLNAASRLRYPKSFGLFSRRVELKGEGYFSVAQDKSRPFIIHLNRVNVRVTGTKFDVKAYPDEKNIMVMLDEGGVVIEDNRNKQYFLSPGELAEYNRESGNCTIRKAKEKDIVEGWRSYNLSFYRTPLREILKSIERQYNVKFQVADSSLLNVRFTVTSNRIDLEGLLNDLELVSNIKFNLRHSDKGKVFAVTNR